LSSVVESDGMFKGSFIEKYGSVWFPELHIWRIWSSGI
jgi:hypothetical protein